jgi:hypothetical protein
VQEPQLGAQKVFLEADARAGSRLIDGWTMGSYVPEEEWGEC